MSEILILICFVISMFISCYFFGYLPLIFTLSENKLNYVSILGAGLLVGSGLGIIIPEGVQTLILNEKEDKKNDPWIGFCIILGFVFMLLVDYFLSGANLDLNDTENEKKNMVTTLGLIIHAAAEGTALGATISMSLINVEIVIFLAIMLHKAPAALGLVTFLMRKGISQEKIKIHLLLFSLSAPVLTLITYLTIYQYYQSVLSSSVAGKVLLFSGGTFIYVALIHVLPETSGLGVNPSHKFQHLTDLCLVICGCLFPVLITAGHSH